MRRPTQRRGRDNESGYALITILFMLGVVAVMLARSLPRDAMRAQRTREETLIYRGEQYARAVELYFRQNQRYPESLNDLEETDGIRFLRRRYRDPITGADEWRLIKMGADGRFEDSLVYDTEKDDPTGRRMTPAAQAFNAAQAALSNPQRQAAPRRESAAPTNPFAAGDGPYGGVFPGQPGAQQDPNESPLGPDGQPLRGSAADFSQVRPARVPIDAGQDVRAMAERVAQESSNNRLQQAQPSGFQPPDSFGRDSISPQAGNVINQLLTTPRPGGLAGLQGQASPQLQGGAQASFQEGIAGVASKSERSGVKVYKERESYNEWEFVYDYREDAQTVGAGAPGVISPGGNLQQGQPGVTPSGVLGGNPAARQQDPRISPGATQVPGQPSFPFGFDGVTPPAGAPPTQQPDTPERGRRFRPRSPAQYRPATPVAPEQVPGTESVEDQRQ